MMANRTIGHHLPICRPYAYLRQHLSKQSQVLLTAAWYARAIVIKASFTRRPRETLLVHGADQRTGLDYNRIVMDMHHGIKNNLKIGTLVVVGLASHALYAQYKLHRRLPPGPKPFPIVGNVLDLPPKHVPPYQHWLKHKDTYGPISSITILGQTTVILHDVEAAHYLLNKKSLETSGRPTFEFGSRQCGFEGWISNQPYDARFRHGRKTMHHLLGTKTVSAQFDGIVGDEARRFLVRVLDQPNRLIENIQTYESASILRVTYGYSVELSKPDPLVALSEKLMSNFSVALSPLTWAVDVFPLLKHLPTSMPCMGWKHTAKEFRALNDMGANAPYTFVRSQMAAKTHRPSYVSKLVEQLSQDSCLSPEDESTIKATATTMYSAGTETTKSVLHICILPLIMFPETQRKAQEELDRVVGTLRLPSIADRQKLPYINAVVMEALRFYPVGAMGFPHEVTQDVFYNGYLIPKGTQLLPAVWWFTHDPNVYDDPSSFDPDRFLEPRNEPNPDFSVFGYGRRICPGRFFAETQLFLIISHLLAAFTLSKATDNSGREIDVKLVPTVGLVSATLPFPYRVVPRSAEHAELVRALEEQYPCEESDASHLGVSMSDIC